MPKHITQIVSQETQAKFQTVEDLRQARCDWKAQRHNSDRRGIKFNLSFDDWVTFWMNSGQWKNRGKRKGQYVMSRFNDTGAYEIGNIYAQKKEDNDREGNTTVSTTMTTVKFGDKYAYLMKYPNRDNWYWRSRASGRDRNASTYTTDINKARKVALRYLQSL